MQSDIFLRKVILKPQGFSDIIFAIVTFNCRRQYHYEVISLRSNRTRRKANITEKRSTCPKTSASFFWGGWWDSNPRPSEPQSDALTSWATPTKVRSPFLESYIVLPRLGKTPNHKVVGVPGGIRTPDLLLRRQLLYPAELRVHSKKMERVMGIEPTRPAWKAGILPLNYTRTLHFSIAYISYHNSKRLSRSF